MNKPLFITFEGIDGCGKTTQITLFTQWLKSQNISFHLTREPGGCPMAEKIRSLILSPNSQLGSRGELLLYLAARAEHVEQTIVPHLQSSKWVISDRFYDATYAYQGYGRSLGLSFLEPLNEAAVAGVHPNITILLDIDIHSAYARRSKRGEPDRMELNNEAFFQRTREGYLALAQKEPQRFIVVDATQDIHSIAQTIQNAVKERYDAITTK